MSSQNEMNPEFRGWKRPTVFRNHTIKWIIYGLFALFLFLSVWNIRPTPDRFVYGIGAGWDFIVRATPPDFFSRRSQVLIYSRTLETIYMAFVATATGILVSIPIAFMAAENLSPRPLYYLNRGFIVVSRSFHNLIVGLIAVMAVGFGAFAGILALTFTTAGFFSKLLAEDIEEIDSGQIEAIKATGATPIGIIIYSVVPQIMPRFVGLSLYRWDINIRASAILGIVGAGGIGSVLMNSVSTNRYDLTLAIILTIAVLVLCAEMVSALIRRRVQ